MWQKYFKGTGQGVLSSSAKSLIAIYHRDCLGPWQVPLADTDKSDDEGGSNPAPPLFSCKQGSTQLANLYTYAPINQGHLGPDALIPLSRLNFMQKSGTIMSLSIDAALHWLIMSRKEVAKVLPKLTIRIPGARSAAK